MASSDPSDIKWLSEIDLLSSIDCRGDQKLANLARALQHNTCLENIFLHVNTSLTSQSMAKLGDAIASSTIKKLTVTVSCSMPKETCATLLRHVACSTTIRELVLTFKLPFCGQLWESVLYMIGSVPNLRELRLDLDGRYVGQKAYRQSLQLISVQSLAEALDKARNLECLTISDDSTAQEWTEKAVAALCATKSLRLKQLKVDLPEPESLQGKRISANLNLFLEYTKSLQELQLSCEYRSRHEMPMIRLDKCKSLTKVYIASFLPTSHNTMHLVRAFQKMPQLSRLKLGDLTMECASLMRGLQSHRGLRHLDINFESLVRPIGHERFVQEALRDLLLYNRHLTSLCLRNLNIQDEVVQGMMRNSSLEEVELWECRGNEFAFLAACTRRGSKVHTIRYKRDYAPLFPDYLLRGLCSCRNLTMNFGSESDAHGTIPALMETLGRPSCQVRKLELRYPIRGYPIARVVTFMRMLHSHQSLREFVFYDTTGFGFCWALPLEATLALVEVLPFVPLSRLVIDIETLTEDVFALFVRGLVANSTLTDVIVRLRPNYTRLKPSWSEQIRKLTFRNRVNLVVAAVNDEARTTAPACVLEGLSRSSLTSERYCVLRKSLHHLLDHRARKRNRNESECSQASL